MISNDSVEQTTATSLKNWSLIKITGDKAEAFLQGQLTCDVTVVNEQKSSLSAICNPQGRVLAVVILFKKGNDYFAYTPRCISEYLITHLKKFAAFSKVTVEEVTSHYFLFGIVGESHAQTLQAIFNTLPSESYEAVISTEHVVTALPGGGSRYLLWGPIEQENTFAAHFSDATTDESNWKMSAILSKTPFIYTDTLATVTPHMLNLQHSNAISFNKGCYVGQEIIARTHYLGKSKRHLYLAEINGTTNVVPGAMLQANDQEVGLVVEAVTWQQNSLALAVIQESAVEQIISCQGHSCRITID
jgi:folate-binding protein YgfZ